MTERSLPGEAEILDQTHKLISTRRVEGTPVCSASGEKLGTIHAVMIEKVSGHAQYAWLSCGSLSGVGANMHPVPWKLLTYEPKRDGYVVNLTLEQLEQAPSFDLDSADRPRGRAEEEAFFRHYGITFP